MQDDKLLKLYELAVNEEHNFLDAHQKRIAFYSSILSALLAGIFAGLFQSDEWYHFAILCIGPILVFVISIVGIDGTFRLYQRFLEVVTVRAKLEQEMGLTKERAINVDESASYWQVEPIIPLRHLESRRGFNSSDAFIKEYSTKGYHLWTVRLFRSFQCISLLIFIALLLLAIWKALIN